MYLPGIILRSSNIIMNITELFFPICATASYDPNLSCVTETAGFGNCFKIKLLKNNNKIIKFHQFQLIFQHQQSSYSVMFASDYLGVSVGISLTFELDTVGVSVRDSP